MQTSSSTNVLCVCQLRRKWNAGTTEQNENSCSRYGVEIIYKIKETEIARVVEFIEDKHATSFLVVMMTIVGHHLKGDTCTKPGPSL